MVAMIEKVFLKYIESHPEILEKVVEALLHKFMGQLIDTLTVPK